MKTHLRIADVADFQSLIEQVRSTVQLTDEFIDVDNKIPVS